MNNADAITIRLTRGYTAKVSREDADLALLKWHVWYVEGRGQAYAKRTIRLSRTVTRPEMLHRVILARMLGRPLLSKEFVDHINCDGTDCRRENLRLATNTQNQFNQKLAKRSTSGFKGVYFDKKSQKWAARIRVNGQRVFLGLHSTPEAAHRAYCENGARLHGEYFNPGDSPQQLNNDPQYCVDQVARAIGLTVEETAS